MQFIILMCCVVSIIISVLCLTVSMKNKNTDEYKRVNQQLDMMSQTFAAQISTLYDQLNRQNNRNQGRTDKIDNAWGDKFEFIVFYNIINNATNSTDNYGVD